MRMPRTRGNDVGDFNVKHIKAITQEPAKASSTQFIVCQILSTLASLLAFGGGSFPTLNFGVAKCDIPTPNE
jgi:hypothetical protein